MAALTQEQIDKVAALLGFDPPQDFNPDLWDKEVMEATYAMLTKEQLDRLNELDHQAKCSDDTYNAAYALGYQAGVAAEREKVLDEFAAAKEPG